MKIFQLPALLTGIRQLKDNKLSFRFITDDIEDKELAEILQQAKFNGWLQFSGQKIHEVPDYRAPIVEMKTPSQRLRSVLFVLHSQRSITKPFDVWYSQYIDSIIEKIQDKLEP